MATRTEHAPGTPSWIDIGSPDPDATAEFYGALFGWDVPPGTEEMGGYRIATLGGKTVAGIGPQQQPGTPWWSLYVTVADVDATVARAEIHNGTVIVPPMDVIDAGRMAVLADTNGQPISIWQPNQQHRRRGRQRAGHVRLERDVHERRAQDALVLRGGVRLVGRPGAEHRAGAHLQPRRADDVRCAQGRRAASRRGWMVWFNSTDTDAAAAKVAELGGTVIMPPTDMSFGRATIVADPQGAVFGIGTIDAPED